MQYLIGIGLVICGTMIGFIITTMLATGRAEELAKRHVESILYSLENGELEIHELRTILENKL